MRCDQLGGACEEEFFAETFEEMATLSQQHGKAMFAQKDPAHLEAMDAMKSLMGNPQAMQDWFESKKKLFDSFPETEKPS